MKRKERIELLKSFLLKMPDKKEYSIQPCPCLIAQSIKGLPLIDPVLDELEKAGFITIHSQPGFGDPAYNKEHGGGVPPRPSPQRIKKYGIAFYISRGFNASKWQWELIKKSIAKAGFEYSGYGQSDWFLHLSPQSVIDRLSTKNA